MDVRPYQEMIRDEDTKKRDRLQAAIKADQNNVSPRCLITLLQHCHNLHTISFRSPRFSKHANEASFIVGIHQFLTSITPFLSKLPNLQDLQWDNLDCPMFPQVTLQQSIKQLPRLKSLVLCHIPGTTRNYKLIPAPLKKSLHHSRSPSEMLHLGSPHDRQSDVSSQDPAARSSPCALKPDTSFSNLEIFDAHPVMFPYTHKFIQDFSHSLTRLKLFFTHTAPPGKIDVVRLRLSCLIELHLSSEQTNFVSFFDACPNVQHFNSELFTPSHGKYLYRLLSDSKWPRCKHIGVDQLYKTQKEAPDTYMVQIIGLCEQNGIKLNMKNV